MKCPFEQRPHHNVHNTLGVDTGATSPRWKVDSIEGGGVGGGVGWGGVGWSREGGGRRVGG
jgi:hypothetical protein